jgi:hypothetical protein
LGPEIGLTTFDEVAGLLFEHRIVVGDSNELVIAKAFGVGNVGKVRIPSLAEFANNQWFVQLKKENAMSDGQH